MAKATKETKETKIKDDNLKESAVQGSSYATKDHYLLKNIFKKNYPDVSCLVEYEAQNMSHENLESLKKDTRRCKTRLDSVKTLPSNIPHFTIGTTRKDRGKIQHSERTGLFQANICDGDKNRSMYIVRRLIGHGQSAFVQTMYCTDFETQKIFLGLVRKRKRSSAKPKNGIYTASIIQGLMGANILVYNKLKVPTPPVMHQNAQKVIGSVDQYFANRERYLRNGKSGAKRVLIFGNPGSGKTTLAYQIAKKYSGSHCVLFATRVAEIAMHAELCAKYKVPTLIIAEECDKWMGVVDADERADGHVKAFLDGYLSHRNPEGELSLLITNYPDKIEKTILLRPGRIHERIPVGALDKENALKVAEFYFKDEDNKPLCNKKEISFLGDLKLTGAQIENIASMTVDYVNGTDEKITAEVIQKVIEEFSDGISSVKNYKDDTTIVERIKTRNMGFELEETE